MSNGDRATGRLAYEQCLARLADRAVGRIAISRHALPAVLPVSYKLLGCDVVFALGSHPYAQALRESDVVAFEVGDEQQSGNCWSVLVVGIAIELSDDDPFAVTARSEGLLPWEGVAAGRFFRLSTAHMIGTVGGHAGESTLSEGGEAVPGPRTPGWRRAG